MLLVTGASGFIGSRLMQPGRIPLYRSARGWPDERLGDLLDFPSLQRACRGVRQIVHCAGYAHAFSDADPALHDAVNFQGTAHLLAAAVEAGVEQFVFLSSVKAVGDPGERCIDESFDALPETPYGCAKRSAEAAVLRVGGESGMTVTILRPVMVYGRGGRGNLTRMVQGIRRGWFPPLPETGNRRSLLHVDDLVRAIELVLASPQSNGQTYFVAHHRSWSGAGIDRAIRGALGKTAPDWACPASLLRLSGACGDIIGHLTGRPFPVNREAIGALLGSACYSPARLEQDLGWRAQIDLPEGLQDMIRG